DLVINPDGGLPRTCGPAPATSYRPPATWSGPLENVVPVTPGQVKTAGRRGGDPVLQKLRNGFLRKRIPPLHHSALGVTVDESRRQLVKHFRIDHQDGEDLPHQGKSVRGEPEAEDPQPAFGAGLLQHPEHAAVIPHRIAVVAVFGAT